MDLAEQRYLLDTNTCIFLLNQKPQSVRKRLEKLSLSQICLSSISAFELEAGARKGTKLQENLERLGRFFPTIQVIPFDLEAAQEAGQIAQILREKGTPIGTLDLLIAAHARQLGAVVVTNNLREFQRVPGLKCEDWLDAG